jgi:uncharacterized protein (TIRG00374 family)
LKFNLKGIIKLLLSLGLGIGLIYWFVSQLSPEQRTETLSAFKRADYKWLLIIPLIGLWSNYHRTQRWRQLLKASGYHPGFFNTFFSVMIMYFANLAIPRLGEVLRCTILSKNEHVPVEKSIGTMVVERIFDVLFLFGIGGVLFIAEGRRMYDFFVQNVFGKKEPSAEKSLVGVFVPIALILIVVLGSIYVVKKHGIAKLIAIIKEKFTGLYKSLLSAKDVEKPWLFLWHTVAMWSCYLMMSFLAFQSLPETSGLSIWAGVACLFFGAFAIAATPGGIGVYPLLIRSTLALYGINEVIGGAYGTLTWALQTAGALGGGLIGLIAINIINKNRLQPTNAS